MIKKIVATGLALLTWVGMAHAQAPAAAKRAIVQVAGDVYRFQDHEHFGVFMVTSQGVIVADPLNLETAKWLKEEIATRFNGAKVAEVLYSHHHWDHISGAAAFPGATIVSRVETLKDLQPPTDAKARETFLKQYADAVMPTETYDTPVKKITLGGKTVEMHYVSSKHADDVSFIYFPAEKILFSVDVVSLGQLFYRTMDELDEQDYRATSEKAMSFDIAYFVGGHGDIGGKQDIQAKVQYLADLHEGVQAGINKGLTLAQIQEQLTLDKYSSWTGYKPWRTLNIEGMYGKLLKK